MKDGGVIISEEDGYTIYTDPNNFIEVKDNLTNMGYDKFIVSEVTFIPNNYIGAVRLHRSAGL